VVALLFLPGVGWVILAGLIVTGLATLGRLMLAATGNGSWLDFALDFVSLLTFGVGGKILGVMKGIVSSTSKIADGLIQAMRDATVLGKVANFAQDASGILSRVGNAMRTGGAARLAESFISKLPLLDRLPGAVGKLGEGVMSLSESAAKIAGNIDEHVLPSLQKIAENAPTKALERLLQGGDQAAVNLTKQMKIFADAFPKSPEIVQNLETYNNALKAFRATFAVASASTILGDVSDSLGGFSLGPINIPAFGPWDSIQKNVFTTQGGLF
jgi:hypothetical protein